MAAKTASTLPKRISMPSVSSRLSAPFSNASIAQAMQPPAEIVSIPRSSHSRLACATSEISLRPTPDPSIPIVSYSGPSTSLLYFLTLLYFPHGHGHPKQPLSVMTICSRITGAYSVLPPSKEPAWKLRVGSAPTSSHHETTVVVPQR